MSCTEACHEPEPMIEAGSNLAMDGLSHRAGAAHGSSADTADPRKD
jgi:hypothetical protein